MKILVVHASAGAGHMKAAEAVYNGIKQYTSHEAKFVDVLNYTSPSFKNFYRGSYSFLVTKVPSVWGFFFRLADIPWLQGVVSFIRFVCNSFNAKKFEIFLETEQFDYIISTHFMPNEIGSRLKRKGRINSKIICAVTDYDAHRIWLGSGVDLYAVASAWTKEKIKSFGVDEAKVLVSGIPIDEKFSAQPDITALKAKLGLKADAFTVLITRGSFGIGPIEGIIEALQGFQLMVVCGHNKALYEKLSPRNNELVHILGLVNNMWELMAASDVMVTKPGGLSISEALVSHLPMIFFNAIPGQETNNIKVLGKCGIGFDASNVNEIVGELKRFQSSHDVFLTAVRRTKELAKPLAVRDILGLIK